MWLKEKSEMCIGNSSQLLAITLNWVKIERKEKRIRKFLTNFPAHGQLEKLQNAIEILFKAFEWFWIFDIFFDTILLQFDDYNFGKKKNLQQNNKSNNRRVKIRISTWMQIKKSKAKYENA